MNQKYKSVAMRFAKGFLAGGLGSVAALLEAGVTVTSLADLTNLGFALLAAFVSGGVLALQKWVSWVE